MRAAPTLLPAALSYEQRSTAGSRCAHAHLLGVARWCPRLARNQYCSRSGAHAQWFRRGSLVPSAGQKSVLQAKRGAGAVVSAWLVGALGWPEIGTAGEAGRMRSGFGVARWCPRLARNRYCSRKNRYCRRSGAHAQWFRRGSLVPSPGEKSVLQAKRGACAVVSAWLVGALGWREIGTAAEAGRRRSGFGVARWCPRLARNRYCSPKIRYCRRSGAHAQWFRRGSLVPSAGQKSVLQAKRGAGAVVSAWLVGALGWPEIGTAAGKIGTAGEAGRMRSGFGVARWCPRLAKNRYCRRSGAHAQWFRRGSLVPSAGEKSVLQPKRGAGAVVSAWLVGPLGWPEIGTAARKIGTAGSRCAHAHLLGVARWCPRLARNQYCSRSGAHAQWFRRGSLVPSAGEKSVLQAKRGACAVVSAWLVGALAWRKIGTAGEAGRMRSGFGVARWCPRLARNRYCSRSGAQAQWFRRGSLVPSAGQKSVLQAKRGAGAVVSAWLVGALGWPEIGTAAGKIGTAGEAGRMRSGFGVARWCPRLAKNRYCRRSGAHAQWFRRGSLVPSAGEKSVLQPKRGAGAVVSAWLVGPLGWPEIGTAARKIGTAGSRCAHAHLLGVARWCPRLARNQYCSRSGAHAQWFRRGSLVPSAGEKSVLQAKRGAGAVVSAWLVGALGWREIGTAGEAGRRRSGFGVARWCPRLARNRYCRRSGAQAQWFRRGSLVPSAGQKSVLQAKRGAGAVVSAWLVAALGWPEIGTAGVRRSHGRSVSPAHCCPPVSTRHFCSRRCPRRRTANTTASRPAPAQCRSPCSPLLRRVSLTGPRFLPGAAGAGARPCGGGREERRGWRAPERRWADGSRRGRPARGCWETPFLLLRKDP
ncbi:uncharacterized protein [Struthio camelus]|uniref:uncharacterized protein isoform X1 n=1 Tax=Struthio camelus TaxID=8801 RepID=UPI003603E613